MAGKLPRTGNACGCKRGIERDNCPQCEGTGRAIDWRAYHAKRREGEAMPRTAADVMPGEFDRLERKG
jgi:hypothetical protein